MSIIFECEGKTTIQDPTPVQIKRVISSLKSYGPSSFASLTKVDGSYLQVAGGGGTCLLEFYKAETGERFRAFSDSRHPIFTDGTLLVFSAGKIKMMSDEWFKSDQIVELFCKYMEEKPFPANIHWRPAPGF